MAFARPPPPPQTGHRLTRGGWKIQCAKGGVRSKGPLLGEAAGVVGEMGPPPSRNPCLAPHRREQDGVIADEQRNDPNLPTPPC